MKKFVRKSLTYFMVFSVILWNVGAPTFAAESQGLNVQKTSSNDKYTICHATGDEGHYNRLHIPWSAVLGHFENNGTPLSGHEDDILLGIDNENVLQCPGDEDPYPAPVVDASFNVDNTSVLITWEEITDERLDGYKVVMSETNPNPAYPGDGYIAWITDSTVTSYDYPYEYVCDQDYYFSVTALYDGHNDPGEIVAGNAVTLNFACETASYCDTAEYVFQTDLGVVGDGCYNGNDWSTVDTEIISMSLAGNYEVYAEVERSEANVQLSETFTLSVASTTGPELEDNEETETLIEQYAGDFDFVSGNNEVVMTSTALCPPDETPNSVRVVKLCLNPTSEPNAYCGDGEVNQKSEQCDDGNNENGDGCDAQCQLEDQEDPHLTVKAHKIVCDSEEYLPNWGDGSGPSQITATTAVEFVAQNSQHCHLEQNWSFQWGIGVPVMPGDHIGPATSGNWQGFDSVSDGSIPAKVDIYDNSGTIKVRENLKEGYVPFSYTPGSGQTPPGDDVSAEIYCHNDILNYDNYDYITNPQFDTTYYCVAFNAEISEEEPDPDPTPWCSALRGIVSHAINTQTYSDVADLNDDGKVNLTDIGMMAQMYGNADDDVCYDQFEDPEDEFHFSCQDYESIGWCDAIVQGVGDFKTAGVYSEFYDLNGDDVIDLSDWAMAAQLLNEDDQAVCYANFVPPLPEMNCDGPSLCGVKFNDVDRNGVQSDSESNLADWTINLYEKYSCQPGDEWADHVVSYTPGPNVPAERSNPDQALGAAQNNDTINFVSLGVNGELVLEFDNFIENGSGDDIQVFETTYNNSSCASYPEYVHVYASQDGSNWISLGSGCQEGDPTFDLGVLPWAKYIKLVDENSTTPDGFDVDGVKALHCLNAGEEAINSTVTTENGYCFSDLEPGDYLVCEEMQEGWENATPVCQQVSLEEDNKVTADFGNYETQDQSIPYAPWCSALLGIVRGAIQSQTYNDVADLNDDGKVNLSDVALIAQLYGQGDDPACYTNFEDPEDEYHWTCDNIEQVDWCGGLYQGITDSYGSHDGDDNYFFVFDLHDDHGDGTYGDGVINLSDLGVMASYLAEPVDQYQCYNHYPFFNCTPNTPPVITLIGDDPVYVTQGNPYTDAGATADDNEDGDITDQIVTSNPVDTDSPGVYVVTYNVTDSDGAAADEVTRTVIVQSGGGGDDPICGNGIVETGEDCDGSAPDGYQCTEQCQLVEEVCTSCGGGGGGGNFLPIISNVEEAPQCEMTNITWKTSDNSPTWIIYGTDENNLDQEYKSDDETKNHSFSLAGLEADTTYYFTIKAENEDGISKTTGHSFTTPPAEVCGEVLGEKIVEEPAICDFVRPSGSKGHDADIEGVVKYPDGTLIRYECDHSMGVYVIMEQMKKHIPTWQDLHDHYFGQRIYNVSWEVFSSYRNYEVETGGEVAGVKAYADGTLLRGSDKKVYIIEHGKKRHIKTLEELAKYAGQEIVDVSDEVLNQY